MKRRSHRRPAFETRASLVAFSLRRSLPGAVFWATIAFFLVVATASVYRRTYPDPIGRQILAASLASNKALVALLGTPWRIDTVSGFTTWRSSLGIAIVLGIWALFASSKVLRGDEETGQLELLAAQPIGRSQLTTAVLLGVFLAGLSIFLGLFLGMGLSTPEAEHSTLDAIAFAGSHTLFASIFVALGAVASQLFIQRKTANLAAGAALLSSFLLRAIASGSNRLSWLAWATPAGWLDQVRPFADWRLGPLLILFASALSLAVLATVLSARKDVGAAIITRSTTGPTRGLLLGRPLADAIRFSTSALAGWAAACMATGLTFGAMTPGLVRSILESEFVQRFGSYFNLAVASEEGFLGLLLQITIGVVVSLMAVAYVVSIRHDEASGRLDLVFSAPLSRRAWLWTRLLVGLVEICLVVLLGGFATWIGLALQHGSTSARSILFASLGFVPLAVLYGGFAMLVAAIRPRWTAALAWSSVAVTFFVYWIGSLFDIPKWILSVSPFYHLAPAPYQPVNLVSASIMAASGGILTVLSVEAFSRRDCVSE